MYNNNPIGVFDSGVGGTSIWKEIVTRLPNENTIYLADSKNAPYGEKTQQKIIDLSIKNTEYLLKQQCKIIVVACNTATTNAIKYLRKSFDIPFIGIEPAIKPAALFSKNKSVGILATKGTLSSSLFAKTLSTYSRDTQVIEVIGKGIVELIEAGKATSQEMYLLLKKYLQPMLDNNIDYLVLGCSHYPYVTPILKSILPPHVTVIDSGLAVAKQTETILLQNNLLAQRNQVGVHHLYTNKEVDTLKQLVEDVEVHKTIKQLDF